MIQTLADWFIPGVTFHRQLSGCCTGPLCERGLKTEKVVPCIGVLHVVYLQAAVTPVVAHISIALRGVLEDWQWEHLPITGYLLASRPADSDDNVAERIVILAVNHR